jgi:hypothetical protein
MFEDRFALRPQQVQGFARGALCLRQEICSLTREQSHHFHVIGLGEHIDEAEPLERISVLGEEADVP